MTSFSELFKPMDRQIMAKLGDDITVTNGTDVVVIKGSLKLENDAEELLDRFDVEVARLEILEDNVDLFGKTTVVNFNGFDYSYIQTDPFGRGRYHVILTEII